MSLINSRLAGQLQRITESSVYIDKAVILRDVASGTFDTYNHPVTTESEIPAVGSFTDKPTREIWKEHVNLALIEAEYRLKSPKPLDSDRLRITERFGSMTTERTYEVVGISDRGTFGYVVALKAVSV
jgi:hypothetical protein